MCLGGLYYFLNTEVFCCRTDFYVLLLEIIVLYLISYIIIFPSFLIFDAAAHPLGLLYY